MAAADLIVRNPGPWRSAVECAFLNGVRDGSLPAKSFDHWLEQDHLFVRDLLTFQALLLAAVDRAAQRVLAAGLMALDEELSWFESIARERGLALTGDRHPTTEAYRSALFASLAKGPAPAMTALWALERAYLEAWRTALPGAPPYRAFVEHWTTPEFAAYVSELQAFASDEPECEAAFLEICRLERDFWQMAADTT